MTDEKVEMFHSCFMVDVEIDRKRKIVRLADSARMKYSYKLDDEEKIMGFKAWMANIFLAGKAQTLSVFKYHEEGKDPDTEIVIDKFIRIRSPMILESENAV